MKKINDEKRGQLQCPQCGKTDFIRPDKTTLSGSDGDKIVWEFFCGSCQFSESAVYNKQADGMLSPAYQSMVDLRCRWKDLPS